MGRWCEERSGKDRACRSQMERSSGGQGWVAKVSVVRMVLTKKEEEDTPTNGTVI